MEDTLKLARKMIILWTQSLLYVFDGNEARPPGIIEFLIRAYPYNVIIEFCVLNVTSPYNAILGRP